MRITFCDLCDESIPLSDLEVGRAVRRKGRSICARCEEAMRGDVPDGKQASGGEPRAERAGRPVQDGERSASRKPAAPRPRDTALAAPVVTAGSSGSGLAVGLAVVALLFTCGAAVFLLERIDQGGRELADLRAGWSAELLRASEDLEARLEDRVVGVTSEAREALRQAQDAGARIEGVAQAGDGSLDELRRAVDELSRSVTASAGTPRSVGAGGSDGAQVARLERSLADLHREVLQLSERLRELEDADADADADALELSAEAEEELPPWWSHVRDLKSNNAGTRWGAVQALGETRDPSVAEHLGAMLKDPDIFVRMATARVLGDLRSINSIPSLIDALEDAEPSVREAAVVSLRTVSGENFAFDPTAQPPERAKRVGAWRDWWERSRSRLLGR